ncbi:MAG: alkaline phosphatase family protein [Acidobacteriota bacterium]
MKRRLRGIVLLAVWAALLVLGARAAARIRRQLALDRVRAAAASGRWDDVVRDTATLRGSASAEGRAAAELRCAAQARLSRTAECVDELTPMLRASPGWIPDPAIRLMLVEAWRDRGEIPEAADLARRAGEAYPDDAPILADELYLRTQVESESAVLASMRDRVARMGRAASEMRLRIADLHIKRSDPKAALAVLGQTPPPASDPLRGAWYHARARAFAVEGDVGAVGRCYDESLAAGTPAAEVLAQHALVLSLHNLVDPGHPGTSFLGDGDRSREEIADPALIEAVYLRLIAHLVVEGQQERALAYYDRGRARFKLSVFSREDIQRSSQQWRLGEEELRRARGSLRLRVDAPRTGDVVLISPDASAEVDDPFAAIPVPADGVVTVERAVGTWPQRWVLRRNDQSSASGTAWIVAGEEIEVRVEPGGSSPDIAFTQHRAAGDGRRRVFVLILDCGDWRFLRYGMARGEMPALSRLAESGTRGVLESLPAYTAVAMESLAWPGRRPAPSLLGLTHAMGNEIAAIGFIGRNPFASLTWLLPDTPSFFDVIGHDDLTAVNMLYANGNIQAGRNAEVIGLRGASHAFTAWRQSRPPSDAERRALPGLDRIHLPHELAEMAAEMDAAATFASARLGDVVMLRLDALDVMTHSLYAETARTGADGADRALYWVYRYVDLRVGELSNALDEDDVLVVMSDHGIRTAMEHDPRCIFIAEGAGIPAARIPGTPALRGIPRMIAALVGVDTDWPATGVECWAEALPPHR